MDSGATMIAFVVNQDGTRRTVYTESSKIAHRKLFGRTEATTPDPSGLEQAGGPSSPESPLETTTNAEEPTVPPLP
jgi:hypothetical protein